MDDRDELLSRIAKLETIGAEQAEIMSRQADRIAELEAELKRRGKRYRPKSNTPQRPRKQPDRRSREHRQHQGETRPEPPASDDVQHHDVFVEQCPSCGGALEPTGQDTDHDVEEIPEPKVEVPRFRRHQCRCPECGTTVQGRNVWCWCCSNPRLAVFLSDHHRSAVVVREALGESLPGVLVTDFYSADHALECRKQRCLVHLLRELVRLRDELPAAAVGRHIRPLIELFPDALALAGRRNELSPEAFTAQAEQLRQRFGERWWRQARDPDCQRIYHRLRRHRDELLVFLDQPAVPADNNAAERDIRRVAATRADGGVNRTAWGAKAFAVAKSIVRTCQKNGRNFFRYALDALTAVNAGQPPPLPLADTA